MKITLAAVADYASVSMEQKLSVMGIFDTIWAASFPVTHSTMFLVLRVQFSYEDSGTTGDLRMRLEDEDGKRLMDGQLGGPVPNIPPGQRPNANLIMAMVNVQFPKAGDYAFVIEQSGVEVHRIPLKVAARAD